LSLTLGAKVTDKGCCCSYVSLNDEARFDLSGAAVSYAKAVETELNALLFPALRGILKDKALADREVREDGRRLDLGGVVPHQTLGSIKHLLERQDVLQASVRKAMQHDHSWVLGMLTREMEPIIDLRNAGAHSKTTSASTLEAVRRKIVGLGGEGLLGRLCGCG
jgi:hypothetical protein